ncbi:6761_t:CDS:2, partial [Racocetra fulgida]
MNNKRPISEVYLEDTMDINESWELDYDIISELSEEIDEGLKEDDLGDGLEEADLENDLRDGLEEADLGNSLEEAGLEEDSLEDSLEENGLVFQLKVGNEFKDWDTAERQRRLEKNKYVEIIHRTFECKSSGKYKVKKKADNEDIREYEKMLKQVEFLVNIGCEAGMIIRGLQQNFSNAIIYPKNVYNAINLFRCNKRLIKTDASETYEKL